MTRSISDELHSSDIKVYQMEIERGFTRSIIDQLDFPDIQGDQMEGEKVVNRSIIDELNSWDIEGDQMEGESMVLLEVSLMNFILRISKEFKWKMKVN